MKVLIVVDMQNDFIDGSLGTKEAVEIVNRVAEVMDSFDGAVICTRDTHFADYLNTSEGRKLPVEHCIEGTKGHALQDTIQKMAEKKQDVVMNKITFGAKNLPEEIEKLAGGVPEFIELVGLCTDICVISNAMLLKAFYPEVPISVDASACAGVTPQSHKNALEAMKMCQIEIEVEQQVFQLDLIPFSCDFVQRNIECLLIILVQIDHDDLRLGVSEVLHNVVALVASDDGSVLVYDDRIHVSEGLNAALDVLMF